jgi:hypothetical protein
MAITAVGQKISMDVGVRSNKGEGFGQGGGSVGADLWWLDEGGPAYYEEAASGGGCL